MNSLETRLQDLLKAGRVRLAPRQTNAPPAFRDLHYPGVQLVHADEEVHEPHPQAQPPQLVQLPEEVHEPQIMQHVGQFRQLCEFAGKQNGFSWSVCNLRLSLRERFFVEAPFLCMAESETPAKRSGCFWLKTGTGATSTGTGAGCRKSATTRTNGKMPVASSPYCIPEVLFFPVDTANGRIRPVLILGLTMGEASLSLVCGIIRATASLKEVKTKIALTQTRRAKVLTTNMTIPSFLCSRFHWK
jgi:hypothetical protein